MKIISNIYHEIQSFSITIKSGIEVWKWKGADLPQYFENQKNPNKLNEGKIIASPFIRSLISGRGECKSLTFLSKCMFPTQFLTLSQKSAMDSLKFVFICKFKKIQFPLAPSPRFYEHVENFTIGEKSKLHNASYFPFNSNGKACFNS